MLATFTGAPRAAPHTGAGHPAAAASRITVVLGDRDEDVHALYGAVLEHRGYGVLHARSVPECLRLVRARRVAAVVVSVGARGLFFWTSYLRLVKAARVERFALVCFTTDPRMTTDGRRHRRCAAAVLMLPCTPEALADEVERVIRDVPRPLH